MVALPPGFQASGLVATPSGASLYGNGGAIAGDTGECTVVDYVAATTSFGRVRPAICGRELAPGLWLVTGSAHFQETLRLAHPGRPANDGGVFGPVLGRFDNWGLAHDGTPVYADGLVWIFRATGEVLRVNASTGRLEATVRVPSIGYDPVMAADDDGLFVAPSVGWDQYPGVPPIYHVGRHAAAAAVVHHGGPVQWMDAAGERLWADVLGPRRTWTMSIWGFEGPAADPIFTTASKLLPGPEGGGDGYAVVVDASSGLYSLNGNLSAPTSTSTCTGTAEVVHIDPATGAQREIASIPADPSTEWVACGDTLGHDQAVVSGNELLLLWGGTATSGYHYTELYRVALSVSAV